MKTALLVIITLSTLNCFAQELTNNSKACQDAFEKSHRKVLSSYWDLKNEYFFAKEEILDDSVRINSIVKEGSDSFKESYIAACKVGLIESSKSELLRIWDTVVCKPKRDSNNPDIGVIIHLHLPGLCRSLISSYIGDIKNRLSLNDLKSKLAACTKSTSNINSLYSVGQEQKCSNAREVSSSDKSINDKFYDDLNRSNAKHRNTTRIIIEN